MTNDLVQHGSVTPEQARQLAERRAMMAAEQQARARAGLMESDALSFRDMRWQIGDVPQPTTSVVGIVAGWNHSKKYYSKPYTPGTVESPDCYAYGQIPDDMVPHSSVPATSRVSPQCVHCPMNAFGTAQSGKGKACSDGKSLAVIIAGHSNHEGAVTYTLQGNTYAEGRLLRLRVPPTSLKLFSEYINHLAERTRVIEGVITSITAIDVAGSNYKMAFDVLDVLPDAAELAVMGRAAEAAKFLEVNYAVSAA